MHGGKDSLLSCSGEGVKINQMFNSLLTALIWEGWTWPLISVPVLKSSPR